MNFRRWCQEKWYEHVDEMINLTRKPPVYHPSEYFANYKYWLKREYKFQEGKDNAQTR
jgi:hypothetical protein